MRELVFKNLMSRKSHKREVSIEEVINQDGYVSKTTKKSVYFVRKIQHINDNEEFEKWINDKNCTYGDDKKRFHILKKHSDRDNLDKVLCKAKGTIYVIVGQDIYSVVFFHTIKMEIEEVKNRGL